jgi:hypothetical protein
MRQKSLLAVAVSAAALAGLSAGPAFAGEVKGPPGPYVGELPFTAARDQANSICAFSGLNDFVDGPVRFHVQSYGIDVSGKGEEIPADPHLFNPGDICQGGSNPHRPPVD